MKKGGMATEARIMQRLGTHPNLVQFYRWARDHHGNEYMIMELVANGSLEKFLLVRSSTLDFMDKLKVLSSPSLHRV
jgi:serine/threonine protein kinase